jgi:hypothetical protein
MHPAAPTFLRCQRLAEKLRWFFNGLRTMRWLTSGSLGGSMKSSLQVADKWFEAG